MLHLTQQQQILYSPSRPLSEKTIQNKNVNFNKYYILYIRQV
jgi:hypothetical protein